MIEQFVFYIIKSGIWIGVLWLIYCLFLKREIFFRFNRIFLLAGMIASFAIPAMQISYRVEIPYVQTLNVPAAIQNVVPAKIVENAVSIDLTSLLCVMYILGMAAITGYHLLGLIKIRKMIKRGTSEQARNEDKVIEQQDVRSSFSLFGYIFLEPDLPAVERQLILEHERAHNLQWHALDIALAQAVCTLQWFNPFAWLYLAAVKQNHEYLADRHVLATGCQPAVYCAALINRAFHAPVFSLTHTFTFNKQNRIKMMKKNELRQTRKLAVLLIAPALAVFLWTSAKPVYEFQDAPETENVAPSDTIRVNKSGDGKQRPLIIIDGEVDIDNNWDNIIPDSIQSITVLKDSSAIKKYGNSAENGVIIIEMKKRTDHE